MSRLSPLDRVSLAVSRATEAKGLLRRALNGVAYRANHWPHITPVELTVGYVATMGPSWKALAIRALQRQTR